MSDQRILPPEPAASEQTTGGVAHILDVPLRVSIHLGQKVMKVREILQLKQNSIVELQKSAGENVDIFINGKLVACGEVLELERNAGVRLTDIMAEE